MWHRIVTLWQTMRRHGGPVAGLAALVLVGCLVLLAAPGSGSAPHATNRMLTSATPTDSALHPVSRQLVQQSGGSTPGSTATPTATPTATNTPGSATPTATATATATPIPPTSAPSWHTIGSYSGSTAQTPLISFTTSAPWHVTWTCTYGGGNNATIGFSATVDGATLASGGTICASPSMSGTFAPCAGGVAACAGSHTYVVNIPTQGSYPVAAWTATVEEWY